jgi:predicted nucleic acid-binding Zn ribbon protein
MTWPEDFASPEGRPEKPLPPALGALVQSLRSRRGWEARLRGARIHQAWSEIAGEELARHVTPVRLAGGVLVVRAESPAWATQVSYLAPQLLQRANEVLGAGEVRTVTVQAGRPDTDRPH